MRLFINFFYEKNLHVNSNFPNFYFEFVNEKFEISSNLNVVSENICERLALVQNGEEIERFNLITQSFSLI